VGGISRRRAGDEDRGAGRASLYDEVTARIVAELEAGRLPWVQPWDSAAAAPGLPRNAASNRAYSGINVLILWGEVISRGYASQGWLTFRQAIEAGGCVRKGEHGVGVVYADRFTPEAEKERAAAEGDAARAVPFLKRFTLFNVEQCDGLPERMLAGAAPLRIERDLYFATDLPLTDWAAWARKAGSILWAEALLRRARDTASDLTDRFPPPE
jgi:antirestriction protein ArdC